MASVKRYIASAKEAGAAGDFERAIREIRRALRVDAQSVEAWMYLVHCQEESGDLDAALIAAGNAVKLSADPGAGGRLSPYRWLGRLLLEAGRYEEAIAALKQCLHSDPDGGAHIYLGAAYGRSGRKCEAEAAYRGALKVNPDNDEALSNLAACVRDYDPEQAIKLLERAVQIDPNDASIHRELGRCLYCHRNDLDQAEQYFRKALELNETDPLTHHYIGFILSDWRQYSEAEKHWLRAAELDPAWFTPYLELGILYQNMDRQGDALPALRKALELGPNEIEVLYHLGWLLLDLGRLPAARRYLKRALSLNPPKEKTNKIRKLLRRSRKSEGD